MWLPYDGSLVFMLQFHLGINMRVRAFMQEDYIRRWLAFIEHLPIPYHTDKFVKTTVMSSE